MDPRDQLGYILPMLSKLVDDIDPMTLHDKTPCTEFTVHDVIDHMIVLGGTFVYLFRGEEPPEILPPAAYGYVPSADFRKTMDDLLAAVQSDGALERNISAPVGEMDGETFARLVAFDGLVHGWDLATATGLDFAVPPAVVAEVDRFARTAIGPELREAGMFAAEVEPCAQATPMEQLVAFSGRDVVPATG